MKPLLTGDSTNSETKRIALVGPATERKPLCWCSSPLGVRGETDYMSRPYLDLRPQHSPHPSALPSMNLNPLHTESIKGVTSLSKKDVPQPCWAKGMGSPSSLRQPNPHGR